MGSDSAADVSALETFTRKIGRIVSFWPSSMAGTE